MIIQTVDPQYLKRKARQIKAQTPILMSQLGLVPKFKRWRLAEDPKTGMVVLFGELDNKYIAEHTRTPISEYFDPRLLHNMATELQVQVISSNSDDTDPKKNAEQLVYDPGSPVSFQRITRKEKAGLRYAFVLKRGELGERHGDSAAKPALMPAESPSQYGVFSQTGAHSLLHQRLDQFMKLVNTVRASSNAIAQPLPDVLLMDAAEFDERMTDYENKRNNNFQMA